MKQSVGLATANGLVRQHLANSAATARGVQGLLPGEGIAFREVVADDETRGGNKTVYRIMPLMALTSDDVPDLIFCDAPETILPRVAWNDTLLDATDLAARFDHKPKRST